MAKKKKNKAKAKKQKKVTSKIKVRRKSVRRKKISSKKGAKSKKKGLAQVFLGLGSNVGDREEYIEQALFVFEKNTNIEIIKRSTTYETEPEGGGNQPPFVNGVVEIRTKLSPHDLLDICQDIEATLGREREVEWGPRTIDIDILLYDGEILSDDRLQLPHPLMHERYFVLRPMSEIAPQVMHPVLEKTMKTLYDERKSEMGEKYDDELPGFKEIKGGGYDDYERW